jgi:hypothetical protein
LKKSKEQNQKTLHGQESYPPDMAKCKSEIVNSQLRLGLANYWAGIKLFGLWQRKKRRQRQQKRMADTRVIYCGDNLEQLKKLPEGCVDLIYIDPPFNSNRNYEVFWGETKEKRAFEDRHASTQAYIEFMRPRCVELHRVLKKTGSFYYHCDWQNMWRWN